MQHINFLIKPASSLCNLRCRYCFYEDEAENRTVKNYGIMSKEVSDRILERAFETIDPKGSISFAFQGGEPTLAGLPFFRQFTETAKKCCPPGVSVAYAIQTNGMLLDEQWADFFAENSFLVGISLDGYQELHDLYRKNSKGQDTFSTAAKAARLLQKKKVAVNALCVVTKQAAKHPARIYRELKKTGFSYLQFIACLDPIGEKRGQRAWSLTPAAYREFLCTVFDLWYQDWERGDYHSIRLFDDYIHLLLGDGASTCATCGRCGSYFVVESDGSVFPCDFYARDEWHMGNIIDCPLESLQKSPAAEAFLKEGDHKPRACDGCRWFSLCGGGCRNDRYADQGTVRNYYCEAFSGLLDYAYARMCVIARAERDLRNRMRY